MADDDYAIMPQKQVQELKAEIEKLKKNPLGENATSSDLMGSVQGLTHSINDLMDLFKQASKEMKAEESSPGGKAIEQLNEKIDSLIEQNKKIAKGIVTVADLLRKKDEAPPEPKKEAPSAPPDPFGGPSDSFGMPPPTMGGPSPPPPMGPPGAPPMQSPPPGLGPMPPPPAMPEPDKKKGFFHK